jgi:diguanylate cyclase (GGDEF)-like protein
MQTLNVLDNHFSPFNAFNVLNAEKAEHNRHGIVLLEQLQTTLELDKILTIFSMEAAKFIDFSGLYFKNQSLSKTLRGSRKAKQERQFELKINDEFIGVLTYAVNTPISITNYKVLEQLHQYLLYPLKNALQYHYAMQLAMQDSLTGLGNRRYFDEQLKRALHNANRHHSQIGLLLGDLNKFKAINDTHGHDIGDQVLQQFAQALRTCVRDSDSIFRFGGDEFAILVENASEYALDIIESRILKAIDNNALLTKYQVTCSLGKTFMNRADNESSLFKRADQALYRQKMNMTRRFSIV